MSEYAIKLREAVPPGDSAPVPFQVPRAGNIVDVTGLPSGVEVVQAALGRVRWSREESKTTLAEHLKVQPYEAKAGAYCVFTVVNHGSKPAQVTGQVRVENEQGPAAEVKIRAVPSDPSDGNGNLSDGNPSDGNPSDGPELRSGNGRSAQVNARSAQVSAGRRTRDPVNDAKVEAIIDSAEMGDDVRVLRRPKIGVRQRPSDGPELRSGNPSDGPELRSGNGRSAQVERGSDASAGIRRPAAPMISIARLMKPQAVLSKKQRKEKLLAQAQVPSPPLTLADTDRFLVLHAGHAEMLELALTARAPLEDESRAEIAAAFATAENPSDGAEHHGQMSVPTLGIGEVLLRFSTADFAELSEALDGHAEYAIDDTDRMALAIQHGLLGTTPVARSAERPSPERSSGPSLASAGSPVARSAQSAGTPDAPLSLVIPSSDGPELHSDNAAPTAFLDIDDDEEMYDQTNLSGR